MRVSRLQAVALGVLALLGLKDAGGPVKADTIEEKAGVCASCHGANGVPTAKNIPIIWGQTEGYLYLQLRDFKKGARQNEVMSQIASTLEKDDMKALAAYFAQKTWPVLDQPAASDEVTRIAKTVNSSVQCTSCHLERFQGNSTVPRLAGQSHDYLVKTTAEFRNGVRGNNPGMTSLMKATPEDDLVKVSTYLAGLAGSY
ncbi:c-type cytochrome [Lichenifustis flavocetrariae]|uniref:Cytochrome c4 n=1 Tax=Lichenifustis flavocetrariae TaxID=2949735 RepID=A0AA41YSS1_9HYPH|nr:c-type cytochrome [Lichenifustis flavocetrariae]MCW6506645.1 cytochrome c4 [Lichenifustis flavocetrariae]